LADPGEGEESDETDDWDDIDDDGSRGDTLGSGARLLAVIVGLALALGLIAAITTIGFEYLRNDDSPDTNDTGLFVINLDDDQVVIVERDDGGGVVGDLFVIRLEPTEEVEVTGLVSASQACTTQDLIALDPEGNELETLAADTCYDDGHDWTVDP
jgi:hypothetical protein